MSITTVANLPAAPQHYPASDALPVTINWESLEFQLISKYPMAAAIGIAHAASEFAVAYTARFDVAKLKADREKFAVIVQRVNRYHELFSLRCHANGGLSFAVRHSADDVRDAIRIEVEEPLLAALRSVGQEKYDEVYPLDISLKNIGGESETQTFYKTSAFESAYSIARAELGIHIQQMLDDYAWDAPIDDIVSTLCIGGFSRLFGYLNDTRYTADAAKSEAVSTRPLMDHIRTLEMAAIAAVSKTVAIYKERVLHPESRRVLQIDIQRIADLLPHVTPDRLGEPANIFWTVGSGEGIITHPNL